MYYDVKPCRVCGSQVELTAADPADIPEPDGPVGPAEGYVGGGDPTVDRRTCTNPECPSNGAGDDAGRLEV